ncbi:MAG: Trp family transcriptional regulator [Parcubacteria group bacterium]|jgi:uncharacterized protein YerC
MTDRQYETMNIKEGLAEKEIGEMFYCLSKAISEMKNPQEAAEFLRDQLSFQEAKMIAKRLKVAEFLLAGKTYGEIQEELKVGDGKIARVQEWLKVSESGYRKAILRMKNKANDPNIRNNKELGEWRKIKKKYPAYFWPELLLENIIENANLKQKNKLRNAMKEMSKMKIKTSLHCRINKILLSGQRYN